MVPERKKTALLLMALTMVGVLCSGPANAAEPERWTGPPYEILVTAPRMEVQEERLRGGQGARVSMSYAVRFADLNLRTESGRLELEERVREAATEICTFLAERYSSGAASSVRTRCTRAALENAMEQVQVAIVTSQAQ